MPNWRDVDSRAHNPVDLDLNHEPVAGRPADKAGSAAADRILRAVIPDALAAVEPSPPEPLPVARLLSSRRDDSMTFALPRVDRAGRAHDQQVINAAAWTAGEKVEVIATTYAIVFRPRPDGLSTVAPTRCVSIPAAARHRFDIKAGDRVLLVAIEPHRIVVAYPLTTLDRALAALHAASPAL
ncbi:AbrB/MazE/SpoVT family DNA-binding domain-containing protein [Amycolatopsis sp. NPDC051371]|uniref:AbrB/MazE/SpoVT family DNA-binding domain-containing protein n=1 Tax=Amycolatopsis sp. NPDC051371 TaxID=3155800 RepID=UPI0034402085